MKILILGLNYAPEIISIAVYTTDLAEDMARHEIETEVVSALPYFPAWRVFDGWSGLRWRRERSEHGVSVTHCPLYVPSNPTGSRRVLHHASFALTSLPVLLWKALRQRPDIVFVVAPSMVSAPVGWLAAKLGGSKAWLHIQDFEVEAAFATGLLKEGNRTGRLAKAFERWVLRRFDRISTISRPMIAKLVEKGIPPEQTYELRNWANLEKVTPIAGRSPMADELGITTPHVALYSGNLANKQGLEIIPEMARRLSHREDLTFLVCGDGPMREQLEEMSAALPNIRFLPLQPLDRLSDLLGTASVHLLPQIAGAEDLVLPSKLTNMLASGRPVLTTTAADSALAEEVEGAGVVVPPGDPEAAANALATLLDDDARRDVLGRVARERALERWDMAAILDRLRTEFDLLSSASQNTGADVEPQGLKG
ncbi:WcaI family glycosyltransferase [Tropicimonas marinistellae]|uniref:WcaI family glycosyltransferase n=1 Tax=Tropicimonas marinistellae TaxID=1739787 RepID=UPI00082C4AB4|nr:WcaI family glycosyltransferase [Tropicimonas marinistellae]